MAHTLFLGGLSLSTFRDRLREPFGQVGGSRGGSRR